MAGNKKTTKPAGLGSAIAAVTSAVGIEPCKGCNERKNLLDVNFHFRKPLPLTDEQRDKLSTEPTDEQLIEIFNDRFGLEVSDDCGAGVITAIKKKLAKLMAYEAGKTN